jgi:HTH-type transcriptional regulator/antitoxin HigA
MKTLKNRHFISKLPKKSIPETYEELARFYVPRPLHDDMEYEAAVEVVDWLAGHTLNRDQDDYLEAVSVFVKAYEDETEPPARKISGLELLRHLLVENDLAGKDLGKLLGVDPSVASRILSGQRKLTPQDLRMLSERFKVPADLLVRG